VSAERRSRGIRHRPASSRGAPFTVNRVHVLMKLSRTPDMDIIKDCRDCGVKLPSVQLTQRFGALITKLEPIYYCVTVMCVNRNLVIIVLICTASCAIDSKCYCCRYFRVSFCFVCMRVYTIRGEWLKMIINKFCFDYVAWKVRITALLQSPLMKVAPLARLSCACSCSSCCRCKLIIHMQVCMNPLASVGYTSQLDRTRLGVNRHKLHDL